MDDTLPVDPFLRGGKLLYRKHIQKFVDVQFYVKKVDWKVIIHQIIGLIILKKPKNERLNELKRNRKKNDNQHIKLKSDIVLIATEIQTLKLQ